MMDQCTVGIKRLYINPQIYFNCKKKLTSKEENDELIEKKENISLNIKFNFGLNLNLIRM